jgi:exosortase E/protease (VPEID-CTERM system)
LQAGFRLQHTSAVREHSGGQSDRSGAAPTQLPVLLCGAWIGLVLLLAGELVALTLPFHAETDLAASARWVQLFIYLQESLRPAFATAAATAIFFSWSVIREEFQRTVAEGLRRVISLRWFAVHLALLGTLTLGSMARRDGRLTSVGAWEGWLLGWSALALATLASWCFAAMPPRFWANWIRRSPLALAGGAAVGLTAIVVGDSLKGLWWVLDRPTFELVAILLRLLGQDTIAIPHDLVIGTSTFAVSIGPACSGLEGIGLISVFVAVYLWYRRRDLIFPRALLLVPIGVVAIWILNAVRIAALVLIGKWNPDAAVKGFHSVAGWLLFNALACGLVWTSWRFDIFARPHDDHPAPGPAGAFLLPMLLLLASTTVARAFAPNLELLYPLGIVAGLVVLWLYRAELSVLPWDFSWLPIAAGGLVSALWFGWSRGAALGDTMMMGGRVLTLRDASAWVVIGVAGALIAVPIAEELAFRGYVARRLISADFETVPFSQFSWLAFLGSSIAFGVLHTAWIPATLAGMVYAGVMYRRGRLTDAIVAHVTSCALLLFATIIPL